MILFKFLALLLGIIFAFCILGSIINDIVDFINWKN